MGYNGRGCNEEKVEAVYRFIVDYKTAHDGDSPNSRQILAGAGVSSTSMVTYYLKKLADDGRITLCHEPYRGLEIRVRGGQWTLVGPS